MTLVQGDCEECREACHGAAPASLEVGESGPASADPVCCCEQTFCEVFVRSLADSDGDGAGDLQGLLGRRDYLNDGCNASTTPRRGCSWR